MHKVLITGGAGFIGSSLATKLAETNNYQVVVADNLLTGFSSNLDTSNPNLKFIKADVNKFNEVSAIMTAYSFDYVFHYAAVVGVKRTLDNPVMVLEDLQGFKNVLDLCKNTGVKRVFFSSSSEVYGEPVELPQNELTTPLNSRLPYAVVKNVGESFCRSYKQEFDLDYTIFRFFNTYGPKQSEDFVISKFLRMALNGEDITVYGDGSQTRTFCYVEDNLQATMNCLEKDMVVNDVINLGSDVEITIKELAETIIEVTGSSSKIVHLPPLKEGDMTRRWPDSGKMKDLLGRDFTLLKEGLQKVISSGRFK